MTPAPSSRGSSRRSKPTRTPTPATTPACCASTSASSARRSTVAGRWPVALPALLRIAQRPRFAKVAALAERAGAEPDLLERLADHADALRERTTQGQLDGSLRALEVVAGQAWRRVLTPDARGAVTLPAAMAAGAVVLWKTHVEDIKEEAETITTLALADIGAAARTLAARQRSGCCSLDEFGSVLQGRAGARAVALMQRARSSHGQVLVSTQSISDIPSATGNEHLLGALTDNFTGFVAHRQTSPESRDWLAKLFGTREIWQSTDRTSSGRADGVGSRRRAAEFLVRPDEFRQLRPGEAIIATTLGPPPAQVTVTPGPVLPHDRVPPADPVYREIALSALADLEPTATMSDTARARLVLLEPDGPRAATGGALWELAAQVGVSPTLADTLRSSTEIGPAALARPGPWHRRTSLPCTSTLARCADRLAARVGVSLRLARSA